MGMSKKLIKIFANFLALRGRTKAQRRLIRNRVYGKYGHPFGGGYFSENKISVSAQDMTFPIDLVSTEKLMVILVPEHNAMSGGIYSFFSIANQMRRLKPVHGYDVVVMTRPVAGDVTYFRNTNFVNSENVFRFGQLLRCVSVKDLYIHIPEYAASNFCAELKLEEREYLLARDVLHINLLNQNIKLMPDWGDFKSLFDLTRSVTQSVAHHAYFSQEMANRYRIPTMLLPAYTDLSQYAPAGFDCRDRLIVYSLDNAPQKKECLNRIATRFPDFELIEIKGITFDKYMEYATRCMFAITFGEGFDGYLAQPIQQGGVSFAVYNDDFFPSGRFKEYFNIFSSPEEMVDEICERMSILLGDEARYSALSAAFQQEYKILYSYEEYVDQLRKLSLKQFEIAPLC